MQKQHFSYLFEPRRMRGMEITVKENRGQKKRKYINAFQLLVISLASNLAILEYSSMQKLEKHIRLLITIWM